MADPEGGRGGLTPPPPLKNHKNIGLLSKTGPDLLKKSQSYRASFQCWAIIGTPAERHWNGVSLADRWWPAFSGTWITSSNTKKNVGLPLKNLSGIAHDRDHNSLCLMFVRSKGGCLNTGSLGQVIKHLQTYRTNEPRHVISNNVAF